MARPMCAEVECIEPGSSLRRLPIEPFAVEVWMCLEHLSQYDALHGGA